MFEQPMCAAVPLILHPGSWIMCAVPSLFPRVRTTLEKKISEKNGTQPQAAFI